MKVKLKYNTLPPPHLLHGLYTLNAVLDTCLNITITESTHALLNVDDSSGGFRKCINIKELISFGQTTLYVNFNGE